VVRPAQLETTALGAAYLAGLGVGFWDSPDAVLSARAVERRFEPKMGRDERETLRVTWRTAVQRARNSA
jgi:glycerol kinase